MAPWEAVVLLAVVAASRRLASLHLLLSIRLTLVGGGALAGCLPQARSAELIGAAARACGGSSFEHDAQAQHTAQ